MSSFTRVRKCVRVSRPLSEMHPRCAQPELLETCQEMGVTAVAYSPLGCGELLSHPVVVDAGERLGCTPAQTLLAWNLRRGTGVVPKSVSADRIAENGGEEMWAAVEAWDRLKRSEEEEGDWMTCSAEEKEEMAAAREAFRRLDALDDGTRYCWDPSAVS